jgi:ABC-2 type transport system permease protein
LSSRRLFAIAHKEWLHVRRDPRSLAVALGLPILLLIIMGAGINFDLTDLPFALCDYDRSQESRRLQQTLMHTQLFRLVATVQNTNQGERLLQDGLCLFVLVIPPRFETDLIRGEPVALQMLLDGSDANSATIARNYVIGALSRYTDERVQEARMRRGALLQVTRPQVRITRRILYNPALESRQFIVPGLIVVIVVILGALLTSGTIARERDRGTFETLAASPLLPYVAIGMADVLLTVATGALVFHVYIAGSVMLFLLCGIVFVISALALGLFVSVISRTQQQAMVAAIVATMLPSILVSGFAFPIRNMPLILKAIAAVLPATHFLVIARGIYLKNVGLGVLWPPLLILLGLTVAILGLALARFRKRL